MLELSLLSQRRGKCLRIDRLVSEKRQASITEETGYIIPKEITQYKLNKKNECTCKKMWFWINKQYVTIFYNNEKAMYI